MKFPSLPDFLRALEERGLLKKISREVDPELEITEIVQRLYRESSGSGVPALLFQKVKGSKFPLLINLLGSEKALEYLLGGKPESIGEKISNAFLGFQSALRQKKVFSWLWDQRDLLREAFSARTVRAGHAPVKEVRKTGDEVNLNELPVMKCWPKDGGRFITSGLVLTKSPKTGARNLGIYRLQVAGPRRLLLHWQIQKGGGFHYKEAEEMGVPLEVAVVIGASPYLWLSGVLPLPEGMDEISVSGFLGGGPVPMVPCETISIEVPASSEIVIEGLAHPRRWEMEGPFGDHFGHYSHPSPFPILEVSCITHKKNAIYHSAVVGKPPQEDKAMGEAVSKMFLPLLKILRPELVDLWAYYEAGFHNLLTVSVKQRYEKEGIKTALGLLGESQLSLTKCLILTSPEVDVHCFSAVLKAIRENFDPARDFILLPGTSQDTLDITGKKINRGSKMILDATGPSIPEPAKTGADRLFEIVHSDPRMLEFKVLEDTLLCVKVRHSGASRNPGREVLEKLLRRQELQGLKIIAVVSEDVPLENETLLLWGIFTRFDCEQDVLFSDAGLKGIRPIFSGPMGIDATWKESYPEPVEMTEEIKEKVSRRWQEYRQ